MKQKQRSQNYSLNPQSHTTADVFHLLGILARVTRRIVDSDRTLKQERKT